MTSPDRPPTSTEPTPQEPELQAHLDRFRAPLTALIVSWGAPWSDAAELAQDAFAEAYVNRANCRGDWRSADFFGRWLRGVARNLYRNWARKRARDRGAESWRVDAHDVADPDGDREAMEARERDAQVRDAIQSLPPRQREVVLARYYHDTPVAEIARLFGATPKAIEGRLRHARAKLRIRLLSGGTPKYVIRGVLACL